MWSRDLLERNELGHVGLPRLVEGRVSVQVFSGGHQHVARALLERKERTLA